MTASAGDFLDTNVLVYAFTDDPKSEAAAALLARGCVTSVQGLNEFANVARRKLGMTWLELGEGLSAIRTLCRAILPITVNEHEAAIQLAQRHDFSIFDALMVACALQAECRVFWSEDLQDGMIVEGRLHVRNPFRNNG